MFVPSGYQLIHEALSEVGRDQFKSEWTDEENKARSGLISEEEWLRIKELPGARCGSWDANHGAEQWQTRGSPASPGIRGATSDWLRFVKLR